MVPLVSSMPAGAMEKKTNVGDAPWNASAVSGRVLVTFDVDGTLVKAVDRNSNRLHKRAFSHAFKEIFGVDGHIDVIQVTVRQQVAPRIDVIMAVHRLRSDSLFASVSTGSMCCREKMRRNDLLQ